MLKRTAFPLLFALASTHFLACNAEPPTACQTGSSACFSELESILVCTDAQWAVERCDEGEICHESRCQALTCRPRSKTCLEGKVVTCSGDGSVWSAPEACGDGEVCANGRCEARLCEPNALRCTADETGSERCAADGTHWAPAADCGAGSRCADGACLRESCTPGERTCSATSVYECVGAGDWKETACPAGEECVFGRCVECLMNDQCVDGSVCEDGACVVVPLDIVTDSLPAGTINAAYAATIEAEGGKPPYVFTVTAGALPAGLALSPEGALSGRATAAGNTSFTVLATDALGATASQPFTLSILAEGELKITTASLKTADLDYPYSFDLKAAGGVPPYAWQSLQPMPGGLALTSSGRIEGTPTDEGDFPLTLRVLDVRTPPGYAAKDFTLTVKIAPLEIIGGEQEINLFIAKLLTLPLIVQYIPYSQQLQARGGRKPYTWTEQNPGVPLPGVTFGLPPGLTLSSSGKLSGTVTDTSTATTLNLMGFNLTGYFFGARVTDSQNPAKTKDAIYFIPTIAL